jgi:hypothetical protein
MARLLGTGGPTAGPSLYRASEAPRRDRLQSADLRRFRFGMAVALVLLLVLAGGASRIDEDQQAVVRLGAVGVIAASLWPLEIAALGRYRGFLWFGAAAAGLLVLQLVPLPPALWAALPGREPYAEIAARAGATGWRPLTLTPDLTRDALFALLPVCAALLSFAWLDGHGRARIIEILVLAACASAVLGWLQLAGGDAFLHFYRETNLGSATGVFANRNHAAALLACALPLAGAAAVLRLRAGDSARRVVAVAGAVFATVLLGIVATGSRMGLVLGVLGLAASGWCVLGGGVLPRLRPRAWLAGGAMVLGVAAVVGFGLARSGSLARLAGTDAAAETRAAMLAPLTETARAFLPLGAGFGSFDSVYRHFEPDGLLSTIYMNQAHNEPLQLAIEGGVPALLLLAVFGWWWMRAAARAVRARLPEQRVSGIAAASATAILLVSSLVDYPLRTPLLAAVFVLLAMSLDRAARRR